MTALSSSRFDTIPTLLLGPIKLGVGRLDQVQRRKLQRRCHTGNAIAQSDFLDPSLCADRENIERRDRFPHTLGHSAGSLQPGIRRCPIKRMVSGTSSMMRILAGCSIVWLLRFQGDTLGASNSLDEFAGGGEVQLLDRLFQALDCLFLTRRRQRVLQLLEGLFRHQLVAS